MVLSVASATNRARETCRARACTLASDRARLIEMPAVENGMFSPSEFENTLLTTGGKVRLLRTRKYMYSESRRRKDQTDGIELLWCFPAS